MGKGENVPSTVGYFGHTKDNVEVYNKSSTPNKSVPKSAAKTTVPSGVVRGDGTETRKGITVKHIQATNSFKKGGDAGALPGGVKKHSGLSAPKRVK